MVSVELVGQQTVHRFPNVRIACRRDKDYCIPDLGRKKIPPGEFQAGFYKTNFNSIQPVISVSLALYHFRKRGPCKFRGGISVNPVRWN